MSAQSFEPEIFMEAEVSELVRAFRRLEQVTGKKMSQLVLQNGRLIGWNLAHNTQPWGMDMAAKKLGEAAVMRDVGMVYVTAQRIFKMLQEKGMKEFAKGWYKLVKQGGYGQAEKMLRTTDLRERNTPIFAPLDPEMHQKSRSRYDGAVHRHRPAQIVPDGTKAIRDYGKQRAALVGFGKAGWITAASQLGNVRQVPGWIMRHKGTAPGHAENYTQRADPHVKMTNAVRYASKILPDSAVAEALRMQREKMLAHAEHVLVSSAKEAGMEAQATRPAEALPEAA